LKQLFVATLQLLKDFMDEYSDSIISKIDAIKFEKALMTLCLFCIGGQRREFVVNITLDVSYCFIF
jgi:hypothetical protein